MRGPDLRIALVAVLSLSALSRAADPLSAVFDRIDAAAGTFKGMTADLSNTYYHSLVDETDVQTGTIKLLRVQADQFRVRVDLKGASGAQTLASATRLSSTTRKPRLKNNAILRNIATRSTSTCCSASAPPARP